MSVMATNKRRDLEPHEKANQKRLLEIWDKRQNERGFTQLSAALEMSMTQGAVHQYVKGKIPLNCDAVIAFAGFLDVLPKEIDPRLDKIEIVKRTYPGKPDRLDIHKWIDEMPDNLMQSVRVALMYIEDVGGFKFERKSKKKGQQLLPARRP